ncbi:HMG-box domain-containing protein [Lachnospira eligens]|uniref:HMG-box domain-containing protein n=1 Tax=Lachnospira eligens TaxID=39485 RepID=UPI000E5297D3|nr:hypothetical protein [Lachnospira eligens]RHK50686.1 hypothetical protein DW057_13860 [Lachnospira eligens]
MQDNNIEDDSSEVYVYLKRPFLFNIRYNSREIWNKMTEEDKAPYINYEEFYEEYRLIRLRSIGYPILAVVYLFAMSAWYFISYTCLQVLTYFHYLCDV